MKLSPAFKILEEIETPSSGRFPASTTFPPGIGELMDEQCEYAREHCRSENKDSKDSDYADALESLQHKLENAQLMAEAELEENREKWCEQISGELADQLSRAVTQLQQELHRSVAAALFPLVSEKVREKAVVELVDQVRCLIDDGSCIKVNICGPTNLVSKAQELFLDAKMVEFLETPDAVELVATFDKTVIKTCISEWMDRVAEAIS